MKATIVDLRYRMKDVLRAIDRGETVTVLHRGKAKATLKPISPTSDTPSVEDQSFFGLWQDRDDLADPSAYLRNLRQGRQIPSPARRGGARKSKRCSTPMC